MREAEPGHVARSVPTSRLLTTAAFVTAFAAILVAAPAAFALTTKYAIGVPICQPATPGHSTCFAMRKVVVSKSTPGARRFVVGDGVRPSVSTIGPAGGLTPADLAGAYDFSSTATGSTQTIALVDAFNDPNINADLQTFDTEYSLATCSTSNGCLKVVGQTGSTTSLPADDTTGWSVEESLDVETAHSVCQECKIILVEANSSANSDLDAAENEAVALKATEISNSFGGPETGSTATEEAAFKHYGTVITASSGDNGYYNFDFLGEDGDVNAPNAPASYNTVVAVGGTSLYLGQTAVRQSETVWNDNGPKDFYEQAFGEPRGAGGGGCSTIITGQLWQTHVANYANTACGTKRLVSDISADADPLTGFDVYDSYDPDTCQGCLSGWETIGGTSLASPIIASMWALAGGAEGVEVPSLNLYGHIGGTSLYDVTVGGNGWCDGEGAAACGDPNTFGEGILDCDYPASGSTPSTGDRACDAAPGYDGPSGVGTPNGLVALEKVALGVKIAGPTTIAHATSGKWTATVTEPTAGLTISSYKWNWGDGSAVTTTTTDSATHTYAAAGTFTITLTVADNAAQSGTATYTVKVT
jgi:subtilase family serine protease